MDRTASATTAISAAITMIFPKIAGMINRSFLSWSLCGRSYGGQPQSVFLTLIAFAEQQEQDSHQQD